MMAQTILKNKIQNLKKEISDLTCKKEIGKAKICELKSLLDETDSELRRKQNEEKKSALHYDSRKAELG